ncbi:hypothetical protein [Echinicola strongylocentroti]|nr:hypothetical protein [Echinicola strongylocentroti]
MNPRELRIGNLFRDRQSGDIIEVVELNENTITFDAGKCLESGWQAEPIALTEKLLPKLGFIWCTGRHGEYYMHEQQELFRVWRHSEGSFGIGRKDLESKDREFNTHWMTLNCKYVHQLQNLFYDITELELYVKEVKNG